MWCFAFFCRQIKSVVVKCNIKKRLKVGVFMGKIYVIIGPKASGKTTLANELVKKIDGAVRVVTHTTRDPRNGEKNGVDYYFVTKEEFEKTNFVEYVKRDSGFYGTSIKEVEDKFHKNKIIIIVLDRPGANFIKRMFWPECRVIQLLCNPETAGKRMFDRGDSNIEVVKNIYESTRKKEFEIDRFSDYVISTDSNADEEKNKIDVLDRALKYIKESSSEGEWTFDGKWYNSRF